MYKSTKPVSTKKKTDVELSRIIAVSVTDIVRASLNPTFRQTYFDTLGVGIYYKYYNTGIRDIINGILVHR